MRGRMIMSTIMQAVAAFGPIIDHSFDNVTGRQPNISEFISRNYALIKADIAAHPASGNKFHLNEYQEKGAQPGQWLISSGKLVLPAGVTFSGSTGEMEITLTADTLTYGGLKEKFGLDAGDYLTLVAVNYDGGMSYARLYFKDGIADETALTTESIATCFTVEANDQPTFAVNSTTFKVTISLSNVNGALGAIMSKKTADGWEHNEKQLNTSANIGGASNDILPTYPVGGADFLNGGDIFG